MSALGKKRYNKGTKRIMHVLETLNIVDPIKHKGFD